jgi:regulatory protein
LSGHSVPRSGGDETKDRVAALLSRAMRLLSQRDHSESELRRKLAEQPFSVRLQAAQKRRDLNSRRKTDSGLDDDQFEPDQSQRRQSKRQQIQRQQTKNNPAAEDRPDRVFSQDHSPEDRSLEYPSSENPSLEDREINPEWIDQVIEYCYQHDWLDDTRFALSYLRSRSRKGYGVQRIRSELMQKGVEKEIVSTALETCELDWCKLAKEVAERKFGDSLPTEWHEKAKVQRYLLYRGFFQEEIQSIYRDFDE